MNLPSPERPSFDKIAAALKRQANDLVNAAQGAECMGHRIGLTPIDVETRVRELRAEAELVGEAYRVIKGLVLVEHSVRAMVAAA